MSLRVFYCTGFKGVFGQLPTSAVIVAKNPKEARRILDEQLEAQGLDPSELTDNIFNLDAERRHAIILNEGKTERF